MTFVLDAAGNVSNRVSLVQEYGQHLSFSHRLELQFRLDEVVRTNHTSQIQFDIGLRQHLLIGNICHRSPGGSRAHGMKGRSSSILIAQNCVRGKKRAAEAALQSTLFRRWKPTTLSPLLGSALRGRLRNRTCSAFCSPIPVAVRSSSKELTRCIPRSWYPQFLQPCRGRHRQPPRQ